MIQLYLTRGEHVQGMTLQLPTDPAEIRQVCGVLDGVNAAPTLVRILRVNLPIPILEQHLKKVEIDGEYGIEKLNALAQSISEMDSKMRELFTAALEVEHIHRLDDILRLMERLNPYVLIRHVRNYRELGRFLVASGYKNFAEDVQPYLDYAGIAREYCVEHGGAFTSMGYLYRKKEFFEQKNNNGAVFTLVLRIGDASCDLSLPATEEELEQAKQLLCLKDFNYCRIDCIHHIPELVELLPQCGMRVELANELAQCITEMQGEKDVLDKYLAVLSVEKPLLFSKALELASYLDDYEIIMEDEEEYGKSALRRCGADDALLEVIEEYMDFDRYGEDVMRKEGVRQTDFGLIRRLSTPFEGGLYG